MEERPNIRSMDDSELEQVSGGKSYREWMDYIIEYICCAPMEERGQLLSEAYYNVRTDPDLNSGEKHLLEMMLNTYMGKPMDQ